MYRLANWLLTYPSNFEFADSEFTLNLDAKDFERVCEGLLGVESHRCNLHSLCGVLMYARIYVVAYSLGLITYEITLHTG